MSTKVELGDDTVDSLFEIMVAYLKMAQSERKKNKELLAQLELTAKHAQLTKDNEAIEKGMAEAKARDVMRSEANLALIVGVVQGLAQIGAAVVSAGTVLGSAGTSVGIAPGSVPGSKPSAAPPSSDFCARVLECCKAAGIRF